MTQQEKLVIARALSWHDTVGGHPWEAAAARQALMNAVEDLKDHYRKLEAVHAPKRRLPTLAKLLGVRK